MVEGLLQPFTFLDIDTVLISSRHMYRMPYSFNEKSGLVSIPIAEDSILSFTKMQALPQNVKVTNIPFIERNVKPNQATKLFIQAFDYNPNLKHEEKSLKWICGPGATIEDTESVFRKFFTRDEQIIAKNNVVFVANTKFSDESKDFIVRIRSLDTHESFDIKLTLKNIKEI